MNIQGIKSNLNKLSIVEIRVLHQRLKGHSMGYIANELDMSKATVQNNLIKIQDVATSGIISESKQVRISNIWEDTWEEREQLSNEIMQDLNTIIEKDLEYYFKLDKHNPVINDTRVTKKVQGDEANNKIKMRKPGTKKKTVGKTALFMDEFNPMTLKHLDIIKKASGLFDTLIVLVKHTNNTVVRDFNNKVEVIKKECSIFSNVEVIGYGKTVETYARTNDIKYIIRILDIKTNGMNELAKIALSQDCINIYLASDVEYTFFDSETIRSLAANGNDVSVAITPESEKLIQVTPGVDAAP